MEPRAYHSIWLDCPAILLLAFENLYVCQLAADFKSRRPTCVNNDIETGFNWYDFNLCCFFLPCFVAVCSSTQDTMPSDTNINSFNMCHTIPLVAQLAHCSKCSPFPSVCAAVFAPHFCPQLAPFAVPSFALVIPTILTNGGHQQSRFVQPLSVFPPLSLYPSLQINWRSGDSCCRHGLVSVVITLVVHQLHYRPQQVLYAH